jgi:hypothetical protein
MALNLFLGQKMCLGSSSLDWDVVNSYHFVVWKYSVNKWNNMAFINVLENGLWTFWKELYTGYRVIQLTIYR